MVEARKKPRARRAFTREFKAAAVRLVREEGRRITHVARELDLTHTALSNWVKRAEADEGRGTDGELTTDEKRELSELRKKVRQLEMEKDILKKAAAFFAKESV
jgi:transposase